MFSEATRAWLALAFDKPTSAQEGAWSAISSGAHTLVVAPTGSGKTLAAFLWSLDRISSCPVPEEPSARCRILYVSPLKALAVDVERNLRSPLTGIRREAARLGLAEPDVQVAVRTGDTPQDERRRQAQRPPDVLITTPESLFLLLTSQARESLRGVDTVIIDEVHALAGTKRGAHLAITLERLDALLEKPAQRIGLSATVRPVEEVATYLAGGREVTVVAPPSEKQWDLSVVVPVEDMTALGTSTDEVSGSAAGAALTPSIWPHVEERVAELIAQHSSTIVFANSRRLSERLTSQLNERWQEAHDTTDVLARAHHGSVSKDQRQIIEEDLKSGRLKAVVATSSLELGVDMGAVDLVVQVESPPSVASGLQRVGRAGHQVGAVSRGVLFPKYRGDLVQTAVVVERMRSGTIEAMRMPRNPLDVLAQQIVAMASMDDWGVDDLAALVRKAAPFTTLPQSAFESVLDMLAGRYPSDEFAELRPRIVWDRTTNLVSARPGAQRLAVTSGGTIPDRGLFGVFLVGEKASRVGELDEEMVYESRVGDIFALGASSWRIEEITHDRVLVTPAPGVPGRMPFWKGDSLGRPYELGRALGGYTRELMALPAQAAHERLTAAGLNDLAIGNLMAYLAEQRAATTHVPDDRTIVIERFRDELGDWRIVVHSPFGAQVHAPWALAIAGRIRETTNIDAQVSHGDDGIVLRLPDTDDDATVRACIDAITVSPDDIEPVVTAEVGGSALFASRFRECAARALLLPRRNPGKRQPLWQQRQRSAQLLTVAAQYGSFPILLETMREVLQDVFDVPGLTELMRDIASRTVRIVEVETAMPSPYARSLLFGYVAQFLYEGDAPLAERRAQALTLDSAMLAELLGQAELRDLLDPEALAQTEADLQRLSPERQLHGAEGVADLLRLLGPLTQSEIDARGGDRDGVASLINARRAIVVRVAGAEHIAAIEDAGRLRDALGVALPVGIPDAFLELVADPVADLVSRYARTHGPFVVDDVASRLGVGNAVVHSALERLRATGRIVSGEFRPGGSGTEWCDAEVLRLLRRRSVAALRQEAEPVPPATLGIFLPQWHGITGTRGRGISATMQAIEQLAGIPIPLSALESSVLPSRVSDYTPAMLDQLTSSGDVVWCGHGSLAGHDGWVSLHPADIAALTLPLTEPLNDSDIHRALRETLAGGAAWFFRALVDQVSSITGTIASDDLVAAALWDLAWSGEATNDTLAPARALLAPRVRTTAARRPRLGRTGRDRIGRGPALPTRGGPAHVIGRWSSLPVRDTDPTRRAALLAELVLERHGVITRGIADIEGIPGGFSALYRVLSHFEESGRIRRGYIIEGLGAAQFSLPAVIDRIRTLGPERNNDTVSVTLAATDPANPYGAALAWPDTEGHRPGRKAGAHVVLVNGELALYLEKGGRTLLCFTADEQTLALAAASLAEAARENRIGKLSVEKANGDTVHSPDNALTRALTDAGFVVTPRGLRMRSRYA